MLIITIVWVANNALQMVVFHFAPALFQKLQSSRKEHLTNKISSDEGVYSSSFFIFAFKKTP